MSETNIGNVRELAAIQDASDPEHVEIQEFRMAAERLSALVGRKTEQLLDLQAKIPDDMEDAYSKVVQDLLDQYSDLTWVVKSKDACGFTRSTHRVMLLAAMRFLNPDVVPIQNKLKRARARKAKA